MTASLVGLCVLECCDADAIGSSGRKQVYAFFNVSVPSLYCVGCLMLEQRAMDKHQRTAEICLRYVAFQMAICAAVWSVAMLTIRTFFLQPKPKPKPGLVNGQP